MGRFFYTTDRDAAAADQAKGCSLVAGALLMLLVDLGVTPLETSISGNTGDHAAVYSPVSAKSSRGSLGTCGSVRDEGAMVHVTVTLRVKFNCEPRPRSVY